MNYVYDHLDGKNFYSQLLPDSWLIAIIINWELCANIRGYDWFVLYPRTLYFNLPWSLLEGKTPLSIIMWCHIFQSSPTSSLSSGSFIVGTPPYELGPQLPVRANEELYHDNVVSSNMVRIHCCLSRLQINLYVTYSTKKPNLYHKPSEFFYFIFWRYLRNKSAFVHSEWSARQLEEQKSQLVQHL